MSAYRDHAAASSPLTLLRREDERRLRAGAWRHLRRLNGARARRIWLKVRARDWLAAA